MAISKPIAADVIALTGTGLSDTVVSAIIDDAALAAEDCLNTLDAERQKSALKWLSAHMISATSDRKSQARSSSKLGDASDSYAKGTLGAGINSSFYGQQALAIAPCLAGFGSAQSSIEVI